MDHISAYNEALIVCKGKVALDTKDHRLQECSPSFLSFIQNYFMGRACGTNGGEEEYM
jgi:hypothetical protein